MKYSFNEACGLPEMTFEEEIALPENMKQTKRNKISIIGCCCSINRALETIEFRTRTAPLRDDPEHAALVEELKNLVKAAEIAMWRAAEYGRS